MAYDNTFLEKMLYFLDHAHEASIQQVVVNKIWESEEYKTYNSIFCSLCPEFCDMVIRKSEFENGGTILPLYGGQLELEHLCGVIPDDEELGRYWYMCFEPFTIYRSFRIVGDYVYYMLCQHGSVNMAVKMKVKRPDFDRFLTWAFTYIDPSCFNEWNKGDKNDQPD